MLDVSGNQNLVAGRDVYLVMVVFKKNTDLAVIGKSNTDRQMSEKLFECCIEAYKARDLFQRR